MDAECRRRFCWQKWCHLPQPNIRSPCSARYSVRCLWDQTAEKLSPVHPGLLCFSLPKCASNYANRLSFAAHYAFVWKKNSPVRRNEIQLQKVPVKRRVCVQKVLQSCSQNFHSVIRNVCTVALIKTAHIMPRYRNLSEAWRANFVPCTAEKKGKSWNCVKFSRRCLNKWSQWTCMRRWFFFISSLLDLFRFLRGV